MKRVVLLGLLALAPAAVAQEGAAGHAPVPPWDQETLDLFAKTPVQDEGRVKPLDTFARFTLLRINGKRSFDSPSGEKLSSLEWLLNCLFYPERARDYRCFVVDNVEAVTAIGVDVGEKKRDRFTYNELAEGRKRLFELAGQYANKEDDQRSAVEQQVMNLATNFAQFERIIHYFDFAWHRFTIEGQDTAFAKAFSEEQGVPLSTVIERCHSIFHDLQRQAAGLDEKAVEQEVNAFWKLRQEAMQAVRTAIGIAFFPPLDQEDEAWLTPAEMAAVTLNFPEAQQERVELLAALEKLPLLRDDRAAFKEQLQPFHGGVVEAAQARGEYEKISLEVHYYRGQYLFYSQWLYVLSFLFIAVSWMFPRNKWIHRLTPIGVLVPTALLIVGITLRCIIRERPPVSTLYETILFITAVSVMIAVIIEYMNRQRIAVAVASVLGCMGLFLAYRYEAKEGVDTMPALIAVLDTNFWLSTHVTVVTTGYAAGLLAGALAHVYILGKLFRFRQQDPSFYRSVARMTYGVLCFGLLFATVGTILGGIWANDSWGRFWGWDPKENGALMIVLWSLVILHARMGRYIKDLGVCAASVILAVIVSFSWWGVNNLGVGLHSYGFTSGLWTSLYTYWIIEGMVVALAAVVWFRQWSQSRKPQRQAATPHAPEPAEQS